MATVEQEALSIRPGLVSDAEEINTIYNWYVTHSTITFDIEPWTTARREQWITDLQQPDNPYHLFVARYSSTLVGFSYNAIFRPKAAYTTTTEVTIYTEQQRAPKGTGTRLYQTLFSAMAKTELHRAYAVISQPNTVSVNLHKKFGFRHVGTLNEVGTKFGNRIDVAWFEKKLN